MASDAPESSHAREEAAEREASEEAARPWVALASIPVVYGPNDAGAQAFVPGTHLLLELRDPPLPSYLALPERVAPDHRRREPYNFPYIIAAAPGHLLVMASQMTTEGRGVLDPGYIICDARAGTAARLPDVPAELPIKLFPRRTMGLIADPRHPDEYVVVQLHPTPDTSMRRHDALLCYSTATGQWAVKWLASAPDHEPWIEHGVFAHNGLLWWVDIANGMLVCDPFDDHPHLKFVPLPVDSRPTRLMDQRRCVRLSQGKLRYVEIRGLSYYRAAVYDRPDNAAVAMWTLVNPDGPDHWRFEYQASFADICADDTYIASGLPLDKVPKLALVDPNNHGVVYFFQDKSLFALDVRARQVVACEECFVDRLFEDLDFQYSRFIDAWIQGDDPASSDGGSGSDEEYSFSELRSMLEENMAPPSGL